MCVVYFNVLIYCVQYSWKLLHPTNEYDNKDCPKEAEAYERVSYPVVSSVVRVVLYYLPNSVLFEIWLFSSQYLKWVINVVCALNGMMIDVTIISFCY